MLIDYGACTDIKDFNSLRPVDLARGKKRCEKAFEDAKAQKLIPLPMRSEKEQWTVQGIPSLIMSCILTIINFLIMFIFMSRTS